jgi:tetratricopeptide (TPR) repeat protein
MNHRPLHRALSLSLTALLATSAWLGAAPEARAAGESPWWDRLDQLVEKRAYPAAELELRQALTEARFKERYADRAAYMLGMLQRRSGHPAEAFATLATVPSESRWALPALAERAAIKRQLGEDAAAIALYERLLALTPEGGRDAARAPLADLYFITGDFAKALGQYRELAKAFGPHQERALFAWGWTLVRLNQEEAAVNIWKQGLEQYPQSRYGQAVRLALGNLLLAKGDHLAASTYYNEAARQGQDEALMARAELLAGEAYAESREYGVAVSHYRAVPYDSPLREPAGYGEAYALWQQGRNADAKKRFEEWLSLWPHSGYRGAVHYALGVIASDAGKPDEAEAQWRKVLEVAPKSAFAEEAHYQIAKAAFASRDYNAAIAWGRRLESVFPRSKWLAPALWVRGESYLALSMYQEAVKAYSQLAALGPTDFLQGVGGEVAYKIGMAHFYSGNYGEAARMLDGVADGTLADDALFWQAEARYRQGQFDAARELYGRLIGRYPGFVRIGEAYYGLGWASYKLNDFKGAKDAFYTASDKLPEGRTRLDALYREGLVLADMKDWEGARAAFARLLNADPDPIMAADTRFQTAWTLYRQGRLEDAALAFGNFAVSDANSALAPQALIWQGRSYFRLNRYVESANALKGAIDHPLATSGQLYEAREQLAAAYHNSGKYEEARLIYEQLMQMAELPADRVEDLRDGVVRALVKAGNYRQARKEVLKRPTLTDADRAVLLAIAEAFYTKSQWDEVIETYQAVPNPQPQLQYWAGRAQLEKGAYDAAAKVLAPLRDSRDQELRPVALYDLARAYRGAEKLLEAREAYIQLSEAYMTRPVAPIAMLEAADVAKEQRDMAGAQAIYRRVAENQTFPVDKRRQAWMSLGDLARSQKGWGNALLAYRAARGLGPQGSIGMALAGYWSGSVLVEMRQYKEALKELGAIKFPDGAEPLPSMAKLKTGEALERLNRWKEALDIYNRLGSQANATTERDEARSRAQWIEKNVPKEMRS